MVSALDLGNLLVSKLKVLVMRLILLLILNKEENLISLKRQTYCCFCTSQEKRNQSPIIKSYYEGNVMFYTAKLLAEKLRALGATVLLVRDDINDVYTCRTW